MALKPEDSLAPEREKSQAKAPPAVRLAPSALFFCESVGVSGSLRGSDARNQVQAIVESISPFPMELTAWGFLRPRRDSRALVYAASRSIVEKALRVKSIPVGQMVIPSFFSLCGKAQHPTGWIFLLEDTCVTALHFPGNHGGVPDRVESRFGEAPGKDLEEAWSLRRSLEAELEPGDEPVDPGLFRVGEVTRPSSDRYLAFRLEYCDGPEASFRTVSSHRTGPESLLLDADVCDSAAYSEARRLRRFNRMSWRFLQGIMVAAVVFFLLQGWLWLRTNTLRQYQNQIESRQSAVDLSQSLEEALGVMRSAFQERPSPFDWLLVMHLARPAPVVFSGLYFDGGERLRINGTGETISQINDYVSLLRSIGQMRAIEGLEVQSGQEGVRFSFVARVDASQPDLDAVREAMEDVGESVEDAEESIEDAEESIEEEAP